MGLRTLDNHIAKQSIGFCRVGGKILFRECDHDAFLARHAIPAKPRSGAI